MSNQEKYAGSAWAPWQSMDTAPGPLRIQERSLGQGGPEGEWGQGPASREPEFQSVWSLRTFCIPNPTISQILLNPKLC